MFTYSGLSMITICMNLLGSKRKAINYYFAFIIQVS